MFPSGHNRLCPYYRQLLGTASMPSAEATTTSRLLFRLFYLPYSLILVDLVPNQSNFHILGAARCCPYIKTFLVDLPTNYRQLIRI